jgi:hypothetical protein
LIVRARRRNLILGLFGFVAASCWGGQARASDLSFQERVAAQRAIERIYWSHRIWPKENPAPKPPLSTRVSRESLTRTVEDYLRKSRALETLWGRSIGAPELQAELDRMARNTRDPGMLRELFAALHDDPVLIAEAIARPGLADRLIRSWYATDARFHGELRRKAESALSSCREADCMKSLGGVYHEATWKLRVEDRAQFDRPDGEAVKLDAEEWKQHLEQLALKFGTSSDSIPVGRPGGLEETAYSFSVTAVLGRTATTVVTATVSWPKRSFESWWEEEGPAIALRSATAPDTLVMPLLPPVTGCADDTWTPTRHDVPDPMVSHVAVWTGTEMILWNGSRGNRYDPAIDSWTDISVAGAPIAGGGTGVWTGTELIVWGGADTNTGGRYDPVSDTWTPTSTGPGVPSPRQMHTAVWTGTRMIVWGGFGDLATGGSYDPASDTWTPTSTGASVPLGRYLHTAVWTGTRMIVWGGFREGSPSPFYQNTGGRYDPATDTWTPTSTGAGVPAARQAHTAVWTGNEMLVWGGFASITYFDNGGRYNPSTDAWASISTGASHPSGRQNHTAVWTGTEMVVWGGRQASGSGFNTGGRYNPSLNRWIATSAGTGVPAGRAYHSAVWTGSEMIVWGGGDYPALNTGGRYAPASNSWVPTSTGANVPAPRYQHSSVWTGSEMVVWGGFDGTYRNDGGRYTPATDSWLPTSTATGVPSARTDHTAVWTGDEMIVWGGGTDVETSNTGGRYDPSADSWTPTSTGSSVPEPRTHHTTVWTGARMIVWGGDSTVATGFATGGRYDPQNDSWVPTSTGPGLPTPRTKHAAVWTGTEMIVWGGDDGSITNTGGVYSPTYDTWTSTSTGANVPAPRYGHTAVWTGSRMVVWGGTPSGAPGNTGGRYDPRTDEWLPTSTGANVPEERVRHTAVWTGSDVIVWGGGTSTGAKYDPVTDAWTPTSSGAGAPSSREQHTASWTGVAMIVWGGAPVTSTGALYCACSGGVPAYRDEDGDGYGDAGESLTACGGSLPPGYVADGTDCDDANPAIHPGAAEACNGIDDDCDLVADGGDPDGDALLDACDDCDAVYDPAQSDLDADGEGDACDLDDGMIRIFWSDPDLVEWQHEAGYQTWNAYRGDLAVLKQSGVYTQAPGSNPLASRACGLASPSSADLGAPPAGKASFFLATGVANGVESGLGRDSAGNERPNANPCP